MTGVVATIPKFQFSANGIPMVGGTLETYIAGTTTPATTWQDSALSIANTNPIVLDARGECVLWLDPAVVYKFVLKSSPANGGVVQWTQDNISTAASLANALRSDLAASSGSALVGVIAAGAGATPRTMQDKSRELASVWDYYLAAEADHTGMFNRATAAAARVYAPAGNYTVHNANFPANTEIFGDGENRTIINQRAGATAEFVFTCDSGSPLVANNITGLRLTNLQLRGTCDTDGFSEFVHLLNINGVSDVKIRHVKFKGFRGDGLYLGSSNTAGVERHNQRVRVSGCTFDGINNANRNAISVIDGDEITIENCYFVNTTSATMPGAIDFEPNNDTFPIIRNVTVRNNRFENIGGNVACVAGHIPPLVTAPSHNITIENNRFISYIGTGFSISYNTNRLLGTGSEDNNIKIVRNKGASGAGVISLASVKGAKLLDNEFTDYTQSSTFGGATAITGIFDVHVERNTFRRTGSAGGVGLVVNTVNHIDFTRNKFIDCGTGVAGASNGIDFSTGTSSLVSFEGNQFEAPAGKMLIAIQKEAAHTFTPSTNSFKDNALNSLGNNFQWANGNTKQSWSPVVSGGTTAGACTYVARMGSYVKTGNVVHFSLHVGWTGHTGTGQATVSLPVAPSNNVDFSPVSLAVENTPYTAGSTPCALVSASASAIKMYQHPPGGGLTAINLAAASGFYISGSYMVE